MRFGKYTVTAFIVIAALNSSMATAQMQQPSDKQNTSRQDFEDKLNAAKNRMKEQPQWYIPEEEQEQMRKAMSGEGDYALPKSDLSNHPSMTEDEKAEIRMQIENLESIQKEMEKKGWFDEVRQSKEREEYKHYNNVANQLVGESQDKLEKAFANHAGLNERESALMAGQGDPTERKVMKTEHAVFVSFSMSHDALRNAFLRAKQQGANVYFNGLHPDHRMINETMNLVRMIGQGIENPPMTRFHPEAFDKYNVEQVPTILYRDGGQYALASGILNLGWVKEELGKRNESVNLGNYGPTSKVIEKSIIEEMQERSARIDWEAKQKKAIETHWQKRKFELLPRATENKTWFIDPTVKAVSDIKTPRDELLARKGQIINPLAHSSDNLTIVVFDAQDEMQMRWLTNHLKTIDAPGQLMLITTQIDKDDGWKHLESLMKQYRQRIYLLPKEMIDKFQLTGVPAMINTDLEKDLLKITQFGL